MQRLDALASNALPKLEWLGNPKATEFLRAKSVKSIATARQYKDLLRFVLGQNPDAFLLLDKAGKEKILTEYILANAPPKLAAATLRTRIDGGVRSLCNYWEVKDINWDKLDSIMPKGRREADVRPPTIDEIRRLLATCDLRLKAVILIFISCGCRLGALVKGQDYPEPKLKDLKPIKTDVQGRTWDIASLKLYSGTAEEYVTFVSSEALYAIRDYLNQRKASSEVLGPDSPLVRDDWDKSVYIGINKDSYGDIQNARPIARRTLESLIQTRWIQAGVRVREPGFSGFKEFKAVHGFRSYFTTRLESGGMSTARIKLLRGDSRGTYGSYDRPALEELAKSYAQCQRALFIDEKFTVREKVTDETRAQIDSMRASFEEENRRLREQNQADQVKILQLVSDLSRKLEEIEEERRREKSI
jgi:integrase